MRKMQKQSRQSDQSDQSDQSNQSNQSKQSNQTEQTDQSDRHNIKEISDLNSCENLDATILSRVAHELKTPLTAIIGYAELIANQTENLQECRDAASIILDNSDYLLRIIDDLLEIGRSNNLSNDLTNSNGGDWGIKFRIRNQELDISSLIYGVYRMFSNSAFSKGLYFTISYKTPMPRIIVTDMIRVRQILINLIGNAIKFTNSGGVRIILSCEVENLSVDGIFVTGIIRVDICDTGIGISPEVLPRLFQPYYQADGTIRKRFGGTGLGLSISKRLATRLGGEINVTNNPSGGSTFSFLLPIKLNKDVEFISESFNAIFSNEVRETKIDGSGSEINKDRNKSRNKDEILLKGIRVLIVDDSEDVRRLFELILTKSGAEITCAEDGESAFRLAIDNIYDVILIDINLPFEDGYSVTSRLRESGYVGQIIAITADNSFESKERSQQSGCNAFAAKPILRDELIKIVKSRHDYNNCNKN
ncbi:MAG: response regulator [Planctomycetaceae bacterium]|jgi:signal transduction histidine kinase/CheY-like chemotaxis protein|nr:response regulator [Planctomycetaceae bacterium]